MNSRLHFGFCFLLVFSLNSVNLQSAPPRTCENTGPVCVEQCPDESDQYYQWCGACTWFISCSQGDAVFHPCATGLIFNDVMKQCSSTSPVCEECVIHTPSPPPADVTAISSTTPTPAVPALCESTGAVCVTSCHETLNGVYQWCGRCDYYLACMDATEHYLQCAARRNWDNDRDRCATVSTTCTECVDVDATTPDTCQSDPCQNDASCITNGDVYICICKPGYTGAHCETELDECLSDPCHNNGTCHDGDNRYFCECESGFSGTNCETEVDECSSSPCQNNGTCSDLLNEFTCNCLPGFTGTYCETDIDECASDPCVNGGTCADGANRYTCSCPTGFTGTNCQTEVPPPPPSNATGYIVYIIVALNGTFLATDDITDSTCVQLYMDQFRESFQDAVKDANDLINHGGLCAQDGDVMLITGTIEMIIFRDIGSVDFHLNVKPSEDSITFGDTELCAWDASGYLQDFSHWRQPIIAGGETCPQITFSPSQFSHENSRWKCF